MVMEVSVVAVPEAWIWLGVLDTGRLVLVSEQPVSCSGRERPGAQDKHGRRGAGASHTGRVPASLLCLGA